MYETGFAPEGSGSIRLKRLKPNETVRSYTAFLCKKPIALSISLPASPYLSLDSPVTTNPGVNCRNPLSVFHSAPGIGNRTGRI